VVVEIPGNQCLSQLVLEARWTRFVGTALRYLFSSAFRWQVRDDYLHLTAELLHQKMALLNMEERMRRGLLPAPSDPIPLPAAGEAFSQPLETTTTNQRRSKPLRPQDL
jgi:hypothetical protein